MFLQIGAFDCRHTALMMSRLHRHMQSPSAVLHLWVFEEAPGILARHMLLLSVLLDSSLPVRQRTELFIELHSNALLQQTSAEYLGGHTTNVLVPLTYTRQATPCMDCVQLCNQAPRLNK